MAHWSGLPFRMSFARMRERLRGRNTYVMVPGGATPRGALGYVNAALELAHQVDAGVCPPPEAIVLAVGSTCTSAGLLLGTRIAARRPRGEEWSGGFGSENWMDVRRKQIAYEDREPAVVVIGGSQSGLGIAACLNVLGVDTLVVDKHERVGDACLNIGY